MSFLLNTLTKEEVWLKGQLLLKVEDNEVKRLYSPEEREWYFSNIINRLKSSNLVEGVVQLGSGVNGYKDEYSDIDLMVSTQKVDEVVETKGFIKHCLSEMNATYIKELKFIENIHLLIAFFENGLEFNISILPTEQLNVKSPLWRIMVDRTGAVSKIMDQENESFQAQRIKYRVNSDIGFEFFYNMRKFNIEIKRENIIFALQVLETMRALLLQVQVLNENKKLHQFKAYETLHPTFIRHYLNTYPIETTPQELIKAAANLKELFIATINQSEVFKFDESLNDIQKL